MSTDINPIRETVRKVSAAADYDDLKFPKEKVPLGRRYTIQRLSCENETSAFTKLRVGVLRADEPNWDEEAISPQAATLYWMEDPIFLTDGEQLVARFTGCSSGDKLAMYVKGYWRSVEEKG